MRSLWWKPYFWKDSFLLTCSKRTKNLLFLQCSLTHRLVENELRISSAFMWFQWWLLLGQREGIRSCIISRLVFTCNQQLSMTNFTFTTYFKNKTNKKQKIHSHPPTHAETHSPTHVLFLWWVGAHAQILSATPCTWKLQHVHLRSSSEEMAAIKEHFLRSLSLSHTHTETTVFTARGAERQAVWFGRELSSRSKWSAGLLLQLTGFPDAEDTDHEMLKPAATVVCCNFFSSPASRSATYHRGAAQHGHPLLPFHIDRHSLIPLFLHFFFESLALLFILYRLFFIWRSYYQDHCSDEVWD